MNFMCFSSELRLCVCDGFVEVNLCSTNFSHTGEHIHSFGHNSGQEYNAEKQTGPSITLAK